MKKVTVTQDIKEAVNICRFNIRHQQEGLVILHPTEICALTTASDSTNKEFVESNNLKTASMGNSGGCIVAFPDNLEMGYFTKDVNSTFLERLAQEVVDYLKGKGLNANLDNNDVLVDGTYKVFSTSKATYDKAILFGAIHISINCDADLVRKICTKEMKKIPKGLSDYGITTEEMRNLVLKVYEDSDNVL